MSIKEHQMIVNIGIIGAGRIGKVHADALTRRIPEANVIAIADVIEDAAKAAAAQYGIPEATGDYQKLLSNPAIDAVIICSSTDTHSQFITEAAQAGKQIFCEKPIDFDLGRIDKALAAEAEAPDTGAQITVINKRIIEERGMTVDGIAKALFSKEITLDQVGTENGETYFTAQKR